MKELRDCFKKWINEWSKSLKTVVKWINKALGIKKKKKNPDHQLAFVL